MPWLGFSRNRLLRAAPQDLLNLAASRASEWHPALLFGEFHVTRVYAQAQPRTNADRDQDHIALAQVAGVHPANQIALALTGRKAIVKRYTVPQRTEKRRVGQESGSQGR